MTYQNLKLIIAGSRTFDDPDELWRRTYQFLQILRPHLSHGDVSGVTVISGTASGADRLGEAFAGLHGLDLIRMPADWAKHGKRAGYMRNEQMATAADACIVFWDGTSKGANHMFNIAAASKMPVMLVKPQTSESPVATVVRNIENQQ